MIRCPLGSRPVAPCWDDLCHSGSQTLCGIWQEEIDADQDDDEEWFDPDWDDSVEAER